jgi:hypothetical protein
MVRVFYETVHRALDSDGAGEMDRQHRQGGSVDITGQSGHESENTGHKSMFYKQ